MYKIVVSYETGNSFGHEDTTEEIKCATLDIAKENLRRIKEHWKYYSWCEDERSRAAYPGLRPPRATPKPPLPVGTKEVKRYGSTWISLSLTTEGDEWTMHTPPWCGYFETLHGASIEADHGLDTETSFSARGW
jgi:hypothetical protein